MRLMRPALLFPATFALLLAACGEDAAAPQGEGAGEAAGEVLEGSISDAMIATDELQSQAPRIVEVPTEGAATSAADSGDAALEGAEASADGAAAEPAPPPPEAAE